MRLEDEINQKAFKNQSDKALVNIIYTFNNIDYQLKRFFKKFDLTPQQYNILRILRGSHPDPCCLYVLKDRMLDKMSDASRIVERLRIKQLAMRYRCENDKRIVNVKITPKGTELLAAIDEKLDLIIQGLTENLSNEELKLLNQLLDKLRG
ncbi:MarR family transcriptional regulator [Cytophagaceae bacterium ABcell3]|nr:MarR family transcriptional regulator [Cytophagaceae bacterium ABcell3]